MNCQLNTILKQPGFVHDIDAPCKNTAVCGESLGSELYFQQSVQAFSHLLLKQHC